MNHESGITDDYNKKSAGLADFAQNLAIKLLLAIFPIEQGGQCQKYQSEPDNSRDEINKKYIAHDVFFIYCFLLAHAILKIRRAIPNPMIANVR